MLKSIIDFLGRNKWILAVVLLIGVAAWILVLTSRLQTAQTQLSAANSSWAAATDTLRTERNKSGDLESAKVAYATTLDDLEKKNAALYDEIVREKGDVSAIAKSVVVIKRDTLRIQSSVETHDSGQTYTLAFSKRSSDSTHTEDVEGYTSLDTGADTSSTVLTRNEVSLDVVTGLRRINGQYEIFVRSRYPGFSVRDIQGAVVDPALLQADQKRHPFSVGLSTGLQYNFISRRVEPYLGAGINLSVFKL